MAVDLVAHRRLAGVRSSLLRQRAETVLEALEMKGELSVALVGDKEIHALNLRYRGKDSPTDVLAFPAGDDGELPDGSLLLGDVVISVDTVRRQALSRAVPVLEEVSLLLVHGILHLAGYDHERSPAEARRMFRRQRKILALLEERAAMSAKRGPS